MSKTCTECGQVKNLTEYGKNKGGKFGLQPKCKICLNKRSKEWRKINPNYMSQHYENNKGYYAFLSKKRYEYNREELILYSKEKYNKNKEKHNLYYQNYFKNLRQDPIKGPLFKLQSSISNNIRKGLKNIKSKTKFSVNFLGLESWELLRKHIESQFTEGMNWNNHGIGRDNTTWHIDHIIPISSAINEEEVYRLNHYTNLRPMWGSDNIRKSNKFLEN